MGKFICAGLNLAFTTDNSTAQVKITGTPSNIIKCSGLQVWFDKIAITVIGATLGNFSQTAPANGDIIASSTKVKSNNKYAVLVGDKTLQPIMCSATDASTGATMTIPVTVTVVDASQTKVSAL